MCTLSMHFGWSRLKPGIVRDENPHSKTKEPMTSHNEFLTKMEKVKIYFWIGTIASSGEIEITRWGDGVLGKATVQQIFHIPTPITSWVIQRLYSVLLQFNENTFILSIRPGVEKKVERSMVFTRFDNLRNCTGQHHHHLWAILNWEQITKTLNYVESASNRNRELMNGQQTGSISRKIATFYNMIQGMHAELWPDTMGSRR